MPAVASGMQKTNCASNMSSVARLRMGSFCLILYTDQRRRMIPVPAITFLKALTTASALQSIERSGVTCSSRLATTPLPVQLLDQESARNVRACRRAADRSSTPMHESLRAHSCRVSPRVDRAGHQNACDDRRSFEQARRQECDLILFASAGLNAPIRIVASRGRDDGPGCGNHFSGSQLPTRPQMFEETVWILRR